MAAQKECFGHLASARIKFRDHSKQHYFSIDQEKLKECDQCPLFNKCMFLKYNDIFKEMLDLINGSGRTKLGR